MALNSSLRRAGVLAAAVLASSLVVSACSSSSAKTEKPSTDKASGGSSTSNVDLRLDFIHTGKDAIWTYGIQQGFFKAAGINLTINDGKGSATTAQTVSNNSDNFGLVDGGTWLTAASKGLGGKAVMSVFDGGSFTILSSAKKPITSFQQLAGKSVAITAGDGPSTLLPAVLAKEGIPVSKVQEVNLQAGPKLTAVATGRVDAVATTILVKATLAATGMQTTSLPYSSAGINTPGWYLVASPSMLSGKSALVQKFVAAAQKSIDATIANPTAAIDSFVKMFPDYNKARAQSELNLVMPLIKTGADAASNPTGWISPTAAQTALALLQQYGKLPNKGPATAYFTNQFVK